MKMEKKNKKILVIIGLICFVLLIVYLALYLIGKPYDVRITNLTDSSVTITWKTKIPMCSAVRLGLEGSSFTNIITKPSISKTVDDRLELDVTGNKRYSNHSVTVVGMLAETKYRFVLGSGLFWYPGNLKFASNFTGGSSNEISTPAISDELLVPATIYGKIECEEKCFSDSIVFIEVSNFTPISTVVSKNGTWTADFSASRRISDMEVNQFAGVLESVQVYADGGMCGASQVVTKDVEVGSLFGTIDIAK